MSEITPPSREIAIGDIHGNIQGLNKLLETIEPTENDTLVFLGDYIDRGEDSYAVVERLIDLKNNSPAKVITLMGNHEKMLINSSSDSLDKGHWKKLWAANGGGQTVKSYKEHGFNKIPEHHLEFFRTLDIRHENELFIYSHATPTPNIPINQESEENLLWQRAKPEFNKNGYSHQSGKVVVCGHTTQHTFPSTMGRMLLIDTGSGKGGTLTALNVRTMECFTVHQNYEVTESILPFDKFKKEPPLQVPNDGKLPEPPASMKGKFKP